MIKIYYGLSGTFKTTTILAGKDLSQDTAIVWSMIKRWKELESGIFKGQTMITDLNFAMLHLCNLENVIKNNPKNLLIERGVTDMAYYWLRNNSAKDDNWIKQITEKEMNLCKTLDENVEKILLVQNDTKFIKDVVFKEKTRSDVFPGGVEEYLKTQQEYIDFTERYNKITKKIIIDNSEDYLTKNLKLKLKV